MTDHPIPSVTEADFAVLARRAGLPLDAAQRQALFEVYGHLEAMLERVRKPCGLGQEWGQEWGQERGRDAEPAHVFVPGQGWAAP